MELVLWSILTSILVLGFLQGLWKSMKNTIPGPISFPFVGSLHELIMNTPDMFTAVHKGTARICRKYGHITKIGLGAEDWIILTGFKEIKEFSMKSEAVSRPYMPALISLYAFDQKLGVIFADGDLWQDQRKFMAKTVKDMSEGKKPFETQILEEWRLFYQYLRDHVKKQNGSIFEGRTFFDLATLNVIWRLATAQRFEYTDSNAKEMIAYIETFTMEKFLGIMAGIPHARDLPFLRNVYARVKECMTKFQSRLSKVIDELPKDIDDQYETSSSYVQKFIDEKNIETNKYFTNEQLIVSLLDFFTGGSGTVSKTLSFCLLYLLHNGEALNEIRREALAIDQDEIDLSNIKDMPFTEAAILEVQRMASVLPISPPRQTTSEIKVAGHTLPAGQRVQMNLYAMHHDPDHWTNPHHFNPRRFLNKDNVVQHDEWLQPFGYGKRKCLGERVAKNTIFLFLANLIKNFHFVTPNGHTLPDTEPNGGLTLAPKEFKIKISCIQED